MQECWVLEKKEKKPDMIFTKPTVEKSKNSAVEKTNEEDDFKPFISEDSVTSWNRQIKQH